MTVRFARIDLLVFVDTGAYLRYRNRYAKEVTVHVSWVFYTLSAYRPIIANDLLTFAPCTQSLT